MKLFETKKFNVEEEWHIDGILQRNVVLLKSEDIVDVKAYIYGYNHGDECSGNLDLV